MLYQHEHTIIQAGKQASKVVGTWSRARSDTARENKKKIIHGLVMSNNGSGISCFVNRPIGSFASGLSIRDELIYGEVDEIGVGLRREVMGHWMDQNMWWLDDTRWVCLAGTGRWLDLGDRLAPGP